MTVALPKAKQTPEIVRALRELNKYDPTSDEYGVVLDRVSKLHKMRTEEKSQMLSPDTLLTCVVNLVGIGMIIRHEELNVITTKAMSFIKLK